jgi:hypothetical protein
VRVSEHSAVTARQRQRLRAHREVSVQLRDGAPALLQQLRGARGARKRNGIARRSLSSRASALDAYAHAAAQRAARRVAAQLDAARGRTLRPSVCCVSCEGARSVAMRVRRRQHKRKRAPRAAAAETGARAAPARTADAASAPRAHSASATHSAARTASTPPRAEEEADARPAPRARGAAISAVILRAHTAAEAAGERARGSRRRAARQRTGQEAR